MEEIDAAKEKGLTAIDHVAEPIRQEGYEDATKLDRDTAKAALQDSADQKTKAFSAIEHVDADSLKQQLTTLAEMLADAKQEIDQVKTKGEVKAALKHGLAMLDTVTEPELELAYQAVDAISRQNARDAIDAAAKNKQASMNKVAHVDQESLTEQSTLLQEIVTAAAKSIDEAVNMAVLRDALTKGLSDIDSLADPVREAAYRKPAVADQEAAKKTFQEAVSEKKDGFSQIDGVDEDGLNQAKASLDGILKDALDAVNQAKTAADLEKVFRDALNKIDQVPVPAVIEGKQSATDEDRDKAVKKVQAAAAKKQQDFDQTAHVDAESSKQQKKAIERAVQKAIDAINQAKTKDDLAKTLADALAAIDQVAAPKLEKAYRPVSEEAKADAHTTLNQAAADKKVAMAGVEHVDANSLATQKGLVDDLLSDYGQQIDQAKLEGDLQTALQNGLDAIQNVAAPSQEESYQPANDKKKAEAKQTIEAAVAEKKRAFESVDHVDADSLKKQEDELTTIQEKGNKAVDEADSNGAVDRSVADTLAELGRVAEPVLEANYQLASELMKDMAKQALVSEAKAQEERFKGIAHVDEDDLKQQVSLLQKVLQEAVAGVDQAKTRGNVKQAVENGLAAIDAIADPVVQADYLPVSDDERQAALDLLDRALVHKQQDFDKIAHVVQDSLAEQKQILAQAADQAKQEVSKATIHSELATALDRGLKAIAAVADPAIDFVYQPADPDSKDAANQGIDDAAKVKKDGFASTDGVDEASAKKQADAVDQAVLDGKKAVAAAGNLGELEKAFRDTLSAIDKVQAPAVIEENQTATTADKEQAKHKLQVAVTNKKTAFEAIEHVSSDSLAVQKGLLNQAARDGEQAIDHAVTKGDVASALQKALAKVNQVSQPSLEAPYQRASQAEKNRAIALIYQAVDRKTKRFEGIDHVDAVSLKVAKQALASAESTAVSAIQDAATRGAVDQALSQGLAAINGVKTPQIQRAFQAATDENREQAVQVVKAVGEAKVKAFEGIAYVDRDSLEQAKQTVHGIVDKAVQDIAASQTKGDLDAVVSKAVDQISLVADPTVDARYAPADEKQRKLYQQLLRNRALSKEVAFEQIAHVMVSSLAQQKQEVERVLENALREVRIAETGGELNRAYESGVFAIDQVAEPSLELDFRAPTDQDLRQTKATLEQEGLKRKLAFKAVKRVDPKSLVKQEAAVDALVAERTRLFDRMKTRGELGRAFQDAIRAVKAIALPAVLPEDQTPSQQERANANQSLQEAFDQRTKAFEGIAHVDPVELVISKQMLQTEFDKAKDAISESQTKQALHEALADGLASLNQVAEPGLEADYRPLTSQAKNRAITGLTGLVDQRKESFAGLLGVSPLSLNKQEGQLDRALAHSKNSILALRRQGELLPAVLTGQEEIKAVDEPDLLRAYQLPTAEDRQQALDRLAASADEKKRNFDEMVGVQPESLKTQKAKVDQVEEDYGKQLQEVQTVMNLDTTLLEGQDKIHQVESPVLDRDYRPVTTADLAAAKKEVEAAAKKRNADMVAIDDVDPDSLTAQQNKVNQLLSTYEPTLDQAKTLGELARTKNIVLALIETVKDPEL